MAWKTKIIGVCAVLALACARESGSETQQAPAAKAPAAPASPAPISEHAAAGVTPGSHEDWCGEHAVPESQCTRCNPDLIAAFKATGDWCEEHGLPQSQCLQCNPELKIVRPPPAEAK